MDESPPKKRSVALQALKYFAVGLGLVMMWLIVGTVLLVGLLVYACGGHH